VKNWDTERRINAVARLIASGQEQVLRSLDPVAQVFFDPRNASTASSLAAVRCADRGGMLSLLNEPQAPARTLAAVQAALADPAAVIWLNAAAPVLPERVALATPMAILEHAAELVFRRALLLLPSLTPGNTSLRLVWMRPAGGGQPKRTVADAEDAPVRTRRSSVVTQPTTAPALPPPSDPSPQSDALVATAENGVPFCAECAAAKAREDAAMALENA
jgi:hypothetical protein